MISVRNMKEFLDRIAGFYDKAKRRSYKIDKRVVKGRAKCIAPQSEEAFADFICYSVLGKRHGFKTFVDFPITIEIAGKKQTRYVDFVFAKTVGRNLYEILYMVELKMNIGWMRDMVLDTIRGLRKQINDMRRGELSMRSHVNGDERVDFVLSRDARYDLVILSGVNGDLERLKREQRSCNARKDETTRLMILCDGPIVKGCKINKDDKCLLNERMMSAVL